MQNLKKIGDIKKFTTDKNVIRDAEKANQPIFRICKRKSKAIDSADKLVEIEVTMRKCRRIGLFKN